MTFQAIESFIIKRRSEMYVIGEVIEGTFEKNWFLHIPLNSSLDFTLRIKEIEEIELRSESKNYTLLIMSVESKDPQELEFMFQVASIGNEKLIISVDGED